MAQPPWEAREIWAPSSSCPPPAQVGTIPSFTVSPKQGAPQDSLAMDAASNLYGTTYGSASGEYGSVFKLSPSGGGWRLRIWRGNPWGFESPLSHQQLTVELHSTLF